MDAEDDSSPHENSSFVNILITDFTSFALIWSTIISLSCVYEKSDKCFFSIKKIELISYVDIVYFFVHIFVQRRKRHVNVTSWTRVNAINCLSLFRHLDSVCTTHLVGSVTTVRSGEQRFRSYSVDSPWRNCQSSTLFHFRFTMWMWWMPDGGSCVINVSFSNVFMIHIRDVVFIILFLYMYDGLRPIAL